MVSDREGVCRGCGAVDGVERTAAGVDACPSCRRLLGDDGGV
ncbi:hypothetical protein [Halobaculum gomorrense]|nr:hypothetical protein [Halobaculum gomorrense]